MWKPIVIYITLLVILTGCITIGHDFSPEAVKTIQKKVTSQDEIMVMFGEPWRKGAEDGDLTWTYAWYRYRIFKGLKTQDLYIRFDSAGIVDYYMFNTSDKNYTITQP